MKVYVVKELRTWQYLTETRDFINDLRQAELFFDYDCAKSFSPYGCEVIEVDIMETTALSDYTKQVRKEMVQELKEKIEKRNNGIRHSNHSEQYKDGYSGCCCDLEELLDQIQGGK